MQIILCGYTGHMGREVRMSAERVGVEITAGVDPMAKEVDEICRLSFDDCTAPADVIVDFSHHSLTGALMDFAEKRNLPVVLATTGQTEEEKARIQEAAGRIPVFLGANYSLGIATLTDLLECLGSSLQEFFDERPNEKTVFAPQDMFVKEDPEKLKGTITWLVPDAQKNAMEPILLEMEEGGRSEPMPPHEGEEFGYVLAGSVFLVMGAGKTRVRSGCSFCIHPREEHWLMNAGKSRARVLWVSTPPSF